MDDEIETLMVEVRASTQGFRSDIETMRGALDTTLVDGFAKAGNVLERGPEVFVPTSAGRVEPDAGGRAPRDVRVSIQLAAPRGTAAPVALRRSSRQVASSVRRALSEF